PAPLRQELAAPLGRRFQLPDQLPGIVAELPLLLPARERSRASGRLAVSPSNVVRIEQPADQLLGRASPATLAFPLPLDDPPGQPGALVEVGPVELPGDPDRALDQVLGHIAARVEVLLPGLAPVPVRLLVLVRQDPGPGRKPMVQGVELDPVLPLFRPRPRRLPRIPPVRVD